MYLFLSRRRHLAKALWLGGAHTDVELEGVGALRVTVTLGDVTRHSIEGPIVRLTATPADLSAAAAALEAATETQLSLRMMVF